MAVSEGVSHHLWLIAEQIWLKIRYKTKVYTLQSSNTNEYNLWQVTDAKVVVLFLFFKAVSLMRQLF